MIALIAVSDSDCDGDCDNDSDAKNKGACLLANDNCFLL